MAQSTTALTSKGPHHVPRTFGYHAKHRTKVPKKRPHEEGLVGLVEKERYPGLARVSELRQGLSFSEANSTFPLAGAERDSEQQPGGWERWCIPHPHQVDTFNPVILGTFTA